MRTTAATRAARAIVGISPRRSQAARGLVAEQTARSYGYFFVLTRFGLGFQVVRMVLLLLLMLMVLTIVVLALVFVGMRVRCVVVARVVYVVGIAGGRRSVVVPVAVRVARIVVVEVHFALRCNARCLTVFH